MRALQLQALSGPEALQLVEIPEPEVPDGCVVVDVCAAGLSFGDLLFTRGEYQIRADPPFVPGIDVAGVVRSAPRGSLLQPGQRVAAQTWLGACAEVAVAHESLVFPLPDDVSDAAAVALGVNYATAYLGLAWRGALRPGETVLVHGAAGGVGSAAIQVAKALDATVIAVTSSAQKAAFATTAGADHVLASDADWVTAVRELTAGGADVVFDPVGGETFQRSMRCMARYGRLLVIGFTSGTIPTLKVNHVLLKNIALVGVNVVHEDSDSRQRMWRALMDLVQAHRIAPLIGATYPMEEGRRAFEDLAERRALGKIVLEVQRR